MGKKSRKERVAGREQHRQLKRTKKMQRKQKKKVELPKKFKKGEK